MENIKFDSIIVEISTKDGYIFHEPHDKNIAISDANLSDFNLRMNTNVIVNYDHNNYKFKLVNNDNPRINYLATKLINLINRYISIVNEFDETFILNEYIKIIETRAFNLRQEIRRINEYQNGKLTPLQKGEYEKLIDEFIILHSDSYPKVVLLDEKKIEDCKIKVNKICLELSKEFIKKTI